MMLINLKMFSTELSYSDVNVPQCWIVPPLEHNLWLEIIPPYQSGHTICASQINLSYCTLYFSRLMLKYKILSSVPLKGDNFKKLPNYQHRQPSIWDWRFAQAAWPGPHVGWMDNVSGQARFRPSPKDRNQKLHIHSELSWASHFSQNSNDFSSWWWRYYIFSTVEN